MSDTIQGAKSRDYQRESVPGIANSQDTLEYQTVQEISGKRGAADVVIHGTTLVSSAHTVDAGSVRRKIVSNAHGAKKGWIMRPSSGNSQGEEIAIVQVSDDGNSFVISTFFDIAIGDTFDLLKSVTPNYTASGDLNVVAVPGPVVFSLDGVDTEVAEDTVTPANNKPLPSKMFIEIDGITYAVMKDTGTPANTVSVPVEITGASGPINITAGDLNVQLTDLGANFDRTRIGDGTNQLGINASSEALVHDADALAQLQAINANTDGIETLIGTSNTSLGSIDTKLSSQATAAKQDLLLAELQLKADLTETQPVSMAAAPVGASLEATQLLVKANTDNLDVALSTRNAEATQALIKAKTDNLDVALSTVATEVTQLAGNVLIGAVNETVPATDTDNSGLNGRLQRIAQRITSLIALLPTALGQGTMAQSMKVVIASDQTSIPISGTVTSTQAYIAGTPKSAQIAVGLTQVRATTDAAAPSATRNKLMIKPSKNNSGAIFLIPTGGSISSGMEIIGLDRLEFLYDPTDYYLISDTAAQTVEILEVE